jgi:hypothetical protein
MLKYTFCPTFNMKTFTFYLVLFRAGLFIAMQIVQKIMGCSWSPAELMAFDPYILWMFGDMNSFQVKQNFQLWRLVTSGLLYQGIQSFVVSYWLLV